MANEERKETVERNGNKTKDFVSTKERLKRKTGRRSYSSDRLRECCPRHIVVGRDGQRVGSRAEAKAEGLFSSSSLGSR